MTRGCSTPAHGDGEPGGRAAARTWWHRQAVLLLAVLLGVALLVVPPAGAQDPPVVPPAVQISSDPVPIRAFSQPEIAVHPDDPSTLVIIAGHFMQGTCHTWVSRDGGRTWTQREARPQPESPRSCTRPAFGAFLDVEFGPDGTLYFAGSASEDQGQSPSSPYVARSDDLGQSWEITFLADGEEPIEFTNHEGVTSEDTHRYTNTRIAVHPTDPDIVYAGFRRQAATLGFAGAPVRTVIAVSTDGGRTFGDLVDAFANLPADEVYGADQPAFAIAPGGTAHAFTKERPPVGSDDLPRLLATTSTDGGQTWEGRVLDDSVAICGPCLTTPEAAVDPDSGNVYVTFELSESPPPNARDDRDIWFMRSTDGGATFSERVRLNDGLDPDRVPDNNQMFPGIDVAPDGRIDVTWYDFRSDRIYNPEGSRGTADHMGDLYWDVYYTYSTDGGATWAPNVRISDRSMHRQHGYAMNASHHLGGPISVASTDQRAHVTWSDSRNGSEALPAEDVYYTSAVHGSTVASTGVSMVSAAIGAGAALLAAGLLVVGLALGLRRRGGRGAVSAPAPRG